TVEHIEVILDLLQTFEPKGVGARGLKDYLLIQVDRDLKAPPLASTFIKFELENVASFSVKLLSKKYKVSLKEIQETFSYIKSLNPIPNIDETFDSVQYLVPDAEIPKSNNQWIIHLNRKYLPSVSVNKTCVDLLKSDPTCNSYYQD